MERETSSMTEDELYAKFDNDVAKRSRIMRLLLATDQWFNVLLWNGSQDETISSHIHRRQEKGIATKFDNLVCCMLKKLEHNHCEKSKGE
jgi:hypothetical protein